MTGSKRVVLHVGTHKTGTKTLQAFLIENRLPLARGGIYVPAAGRHELAPGALSPGHHALAWDVLAGNVERLREVLADLRKADAPTVVISSEDMQSLHAHPERARLLRDAFARAGYATTIVLYVRAQSGYLESLYAELTKEMEPAPFDAFVADASAAGAVTGVAATPLPLAYTPLVLRFADIFGPEQIVVRPYVEGREPRALVEDLLQVLARLHGGLAARDLRISLPNANRRGTFAQVAARIAARRGIDPPPCDPAGAEAPFAPLERSDTLAIVERFAEDTAELEAMAHIRIAGAHAQDVADADDPRWRIAAEQHRALARLFA